MVLEHKITINESMAINYIELLEPSILVLEDTASKMGCSQCSLDEQVVGIGMKRQKTRTALMKASTIRLK